jgi:hypothetical protein
MHIKAKKFLFEKYFVFLFVIFDENSCLILRGITSFFATSKKSSRMGRCGTSVKNTKKNVQAVS